MNLIKMLLNIALLVTYLNLAKGLEEQEPLQSTAAGPLDAKFASLVNETLHSWHVPGLAIAVIDGDNVWAKVRPISNCQLFHIQSTSSQAVIITRQTYSIFAIGVWHCRIPRYPRHTINTLLWRKHNQSLHCCSSITARRRAQTAMGHANLISDPRRLCSGKRLRNSAHHHRGCAIPSLWYA